MMKFKKYLYYAFAAGIIMIGTQSCFQDLDQDPPFNFPEGFPDPTGEYNPEKLNMPFDGNIFDKSTYQFMNTAFGSHTFEAGVIGQAARTTVDSTYILIKPHPAISEMMADTLSNLGSFTLALWINTELNGAVGLFTIPNTKEFWGNLEVFLDGGSETDAQVKVHLFNEATQNRTESWIVSSIPNTYKQWVHLAFRYDGESSVFSIFKNGEKVLNQNLMAYDGVSPLGKLKFKDIGTSIVVGTLQFQTNPSLTSNTGNQDWAKWYKGAMDQLHFYNKAISDNNIKSLFTAKE